MNRIKPFILPFFIIFSVAAIGVYFRPLLPVDETRYISVAWEMYSNHSFLVPLLNGEPYHHKPPLLFWLIDFLWYLFGVKEWVVRFIPSIFGFLSCVVAYFMAKELFKDEESSKTAPLILSSMALFVFFSSMLTFDVMLSFWVLLSAYFFIKASNRFSLKYFILAGVAIGGGALTKGPVILVHLLPLVLYIPFLKGLDKKRWFFGFLKSFFIGVFIALLWAVPAAISGGEEYAKAIFWGQSANRVVSSFAHRRPFWWYIPMLFFLFMPYILVKPFWKIGEYLKKEKEVRLLSVWIGGSVFLFSLISGKQIQYLLPEIPPFALLVSRIFAKEKLKREDIKYVGFAYIFIALLFVFGVFYLKFVENRYSLSFLPLIFMTLSTGLIGVWLLVYPFRKYILESVAVSVVLFIFALHIGLVDVWKIQSLKPVAREINYLQKSGKTVAVIGKYHDEYHFLGRLKKKIVVVKNDRKRILEFKKANPKAIVIYKVSRNEILNMPILKEYKFRNKKILLLRAKDLKL